MRLPGVRLVTAYASIVTAAGFGVLAWLAEHGGLDRLLAAPLDFWVFSAVILVGELRPIKVPRRDEDGELTISTSFAFAMLLMHGTPAAVLAFAAASAVAELVRKKPLSRLLFNVAQYALSLAAAGGVLALLDDSRMLASSRLDLGLYFSLAVAGAAYFLVNNTLSGVAIALDRGTRVWAYLRGDFGFQLATASVQLGLAPIVTVLAERGLVLLPLLLLPVAAVYRSTQVWLEKEYEAQHDALTNLPNRVLFRERARLALEEAGLYGGRVAVLLIDLDRFKEVNDTLGHHMGDRLLQAVGRRLDDTLEEGVTIARFGGDEFAILLPDVEDEAACEQAAQGLLRALQRPFSVESSILDVEASIGIAVHPSHGGDVDTLLQRADVAMYMAKDDRVGFELYSADRDPHSRKRLALLGELRRAIDAGQLILYYQPKAVVATGGIAGVEALVRWRHPAHGLVPPDEFIPLAEHTGLIGPLTMTVLDAALRQSREWERDGLVLPVAVNLSVRNLYDPEFPGEVARLLHRWEVPAERLEFEITESTVMSRPARARHVLDELGRLGIALAIDDFGTGHSSLAYLKQLPVRQIKIDKSFVMQMDAGSDDEAIVQATIGLARSLGLEVVAEGVETAEAWKVLSALGCDFAQGYYLSRPLPPDELVHWLEFSPEEPTIVRTAPIPVPPVHVHPDGPGELRASQRTRPSADLG